MAKPLVHYSSPPETPRRVKRRRLTKQVCFSEPGPSGMGDVDNLLDSGFDKEDGDGDEEDNALDDKEDHTLTEDKDDDNNDSLLKDAESPKRKRRRSGHKIARRNAQVSCGMCMSI